MFIKWSTLDTSGEFLYSVLSPDIQEKPPLTTLDCKMNNKQGVKLCLCLISLFQPIDQMLYNNLFIYCFNHDC